MDINTIALEVYKQPYSDLETWQQKKVDSELDEMQMTYNQGH